MSFLDKITSGLTSGVTGAFESATEIPKGAVALLNATMLNDKKKAEKQATERLPGSALEEILLRAPAKVGIAHIQPK